MIRSPAFIFALLLLSLPAVSQSLTKASRNPPTRKTTARPVSRLTTPPLAFEPGYRDLTVAGDSIWAIEANSSSLKLFALSHHGEELSLKLTQNTDIQQVTYLGQNTLLVVTSRVVRLLHTKTLRWKTLAALPAKTRFLTRDHQRHLYAATDKGLLDFTTGKTFEPTTTLNGYYKWRPEPSAHLLDRQDLLWIGFNAGEWGGNLQAFDTRTQRFKTLIFDDSLACLSPVTAVCQVKKQVYLAGSVAHGGTSGCITRFEEVTARPVFTSNEDTNFRLVNFGIPEGELITAITYNEEKNVLHYYSQSGIFEGSISADLSKAASWKLLCVPRLRGFDSPRSATGPPMQPQKLLLTRSSKLVLFTPGSYIGIWDGQVFYSIP